ncbi:putative formin, FH2 domain-containing protein [Helianthus annuus]|uniref:Formin-like protein n=1 Tax=Helianthus annuus TaxID=4232 RepID=A0A251U776_HELAN|nr:formin-like protein 1 [Helianthus annuus]KAF5796147.1 putative formin, FH2 domain-containing protein [Helianthus annuus]KAJ0902376.1 putative formin, FH2 domain-containing protein [Helianthus annuus]
MVTLVNLLLKMHIFFAFLMLTCASATISTAVHHRRTLHQPFFPQPQDHPTLPPSQPPTQPPPLSPPSSPPLPPPSSPPVSSPPSLNVPFLSTPSPTTTPPDDQPFFQTIPSPPPPPATPSTPSGVSLPANISSLSLPTSPKSKRPSSKLVPVAITLVAAALLILLVLIILKIQYRKRNPDDSNSFSDEKLPNNTSVFTTAINNNAAANSYNRIPKLTRPSQTSSEFLYLGTLVNSHSNISKHNNNSDDGEPALQKVGSPELRPLPPLSGSIGGTGRTHTTVLHYETSRDGGDSEAFYSPRVSDGGVAGGRTSVTGNRQGRRSVGSGSLSSYSSSSSGSPARSISLSISPPVSLSPRTSRMKSPDLVTIPTAPPPSRPPPPPPLPPHVFTVKSPEIGLSKDSFESSPRLSNSSNDQSFPPVKIPPPPPPPVNAPEVTTPVTRLNPPVLIKPSRGVPVSTQQAYVYTMQESQEHVETNEKTAKPKLKPLHWDKVRASSDREMVWDHLKSSSFKLNEEMIETLFVVKPPNPSNLKEKSPVKRPLFPSAIDQENQVLDPKKSQNISIALRALNVTTEEVCDALLDGNVDALRTELLESLLKMVPTKEEERKLKEYRDESPYKLGPAEKFLKAVLDVPFAFKRISVMLYVSNFDSEVEYLKSSFQTLQAACEELRNNRMFLKLLEAVLKTGNRMNVGTNRGDAQAFNLDTLLKLIDVKGADGKTTLLHFVVQEIVRTEGARVSNPTSNQPANGLQIISNLPSDLSNVKKAAAMDSEVLKGDVARLSNGIANTIDVVKLMESTKFSDSLSRFLKVAQEEVMKIQAQESETLCLVKQITEYFHGNSAKEEAHPSRIFMVVRDFLTVLDVVCKEVGMLNDRTTVNSVHKFPLPTIPAPVFDGFHGRGQYSSSDDESSSSL